MRKVTVCNNNGEFRIQGVDHKCTVYELKPGTAWLLDDYGKGTRVVEVDEKTCAKVIYNFLLRWHDGRTLAEFDSPDGRVFGQPINEDPRAKGDKPDKSPQAPRREARGVAPPSGVQKREQVKKTSRSRRKKGDFFQL